MSSLRHRAAEDWWRSLTGPSPYVQAVVVGARRAGKTTFFEELAATDPSVRVWPMRSLAQEDGPAAVWSRLWTLLGAPSPAGDADPLDVLQAHLDRTPAGVVLVVDDWDAAVDGGGAPAPDACYQVLDRLARFTLDQPVERAGRPALGLVLVTSLPDVIDLTYFSRAVQRPAFARLSGLITRHFRSTRFPMLERPDAEAALLGLGVPAPLVPEVARDCGGWSWLLAEAAEEAIAAGAWDDDRRAATVSDRLPALLDAALLPAIGARPEALHSHPLDYLAARLAGGRAPADFGLPASFGDPERLAPLLERMLTRCFMVVDTENLRIPFQHHAEVSPEDYPEGVDAALQERVGTWLRGITTRFGIHDDDVWLVGRTESRIDATVGPDLPGERLVPPKEIQAKGGPGDDFVILTRLTQHVERHPMARFVLVSGDADVPFLLDRFSSLDRVTVCTPWAASVKLAGRMPPERLLQHDLPGRRPPRVDPRRLDEARRLRRAEPRRTAAS